jgi:hypothetical protein
VAEKMTKSERADLGQLIRKRERVMKALAVERSSAMLAEFESQLSAIYCYDDDKIWKKANDEAQKVVDESNEIIAKRCAEMGIPKEFAPSLVFGWMERGQNMVKARRIELRQAAKLKIASLEKQTYVKIERMSLEAQTEVIANGLESATARQFLEKMPSIEDMMPMLNAIEMKQIQDAKHKTNHKNS